MTDFIQQPIFRAMQSVLPPNLAEVQEYNSTLVRHTNEVMLNTARAVWDNQIEFFRFETEQLTKTLIPPKIGDDPALMLATCYQQWQEGSEKLITHMRTVSDLVRKCGWDLLNAYQEGAQETARSFQPSKSLLPYSP